MKTNFKIRNIKGLLQFLSFFLFVIYGFPMSKHGNCMGPFFTKDKFCFAYAIEFINKKEEKKIDFLEVYGSTRSVGGELFEKNCVVCHIGGNNLIIPEKNLRKETLKANGMNSITAISYQVLNGKNGMPAFGGRLKESEIEQIAIYVLESFRQ
jgi:cytochrome c6